MGLEFFTKRTIAANIIQKFWRKIMAKKNLKFDMIQEIRFKRGEKMVKKWISNLIFSHRILRTKIASYQASHWKNS